MLGQRNNREDKAKIKAGEVPASLAANTKVQVFNAVFGCAIIMIVLKNWMKRTKAFVKDADLLHEMYPIP